MAQHGMACRYHEKTAVDGDWELCECHNKITRGPIDEDAKRRLEGFRKISVLNPCGAFCWLVPILGIMPVSCQLDKGHKDEDHMVEIEFGDNDMKVKSKIMWTTTLKR